MFLLLIIYNNHVISNQKVKDLDQMNLMLLLFNELNIFLVMNACI